MRLTDREKRARTTAAHQDELWVPPVTRRRGPTIALLLIWGLYAAYLYDSAAWPHSLIFSPVLVALTVLYAWVTRRNRRRS